MTQYRHTTETGFNQINIDGYNDLASAISNIGSTEKTLVIAKTITVSGNLEIPSNITLNVRRGGIISISDGITLTINGTIEAGPYQIFDINTSGKVYGLVQLAKVYPHWWGVVENDIGVDNSIAIHESLSSFVNCTVDFAGATLYFEQVSVSPGAIQPWVNRYLTVLGNNAQLICNANMSILVGPVFSIGVFKEIVVDGLNVSTTSIPNIEIDDWADYHDTYLLALDGYTVPSPEYVFSDNIIVRNCTVKNGWQCGIVVARSQNAIIENFHITNVLGSGIYTADIRDMAIARDGYVSGTADDSIAFTTDTIVPDGTRLAIVENVNVSKTNASGIDFAGVQSCIVNNSYIYDSYSAGIRTQTALGVPMSTAEQKQITISNTHIIRGGRKTLNGLANPSPGAIGIGFEITENAIINVTNCQILDAYYAGILFFDECKYAILENNVINGSYDLAGWELATFAGIQVGVVGFPTQLIDNTQIRNNIIENTRGYSIFLEKLKYAHVYNNYFKNWDMLSIGYTAVESVNCTEVIIDDTNILNGTSLYTPIEIVGTTLFTKPISVKTYGAKGDGITDDTIAFQQALESSRYYGGNIYVPKGTYIINRLNIKGSNTVFYGDGYDSILKSVSSGEWTVGLLNGGGGLLNVYPNGYIVDPINPQGYTDVDSYNVKIDNLHLIGPFPTRVDYTAGYSAVLVESSHNFTISNCYIECFGSENILIGPWTMCEKPSIINNHVVGGGEGVNPTKARFTLVHNNIFEKSYCMGGIAVNGGGAVVSDNIVIDAYLNGAWISVFQYDEYQSGGYLFVNNQIIRSGVGGTGYGIHISEDNPELPYIQPIVIKNNFIYQTRNTLGIHASLFHPNSTVLIDGNTITETGIDYIGSAVGIWLSGNATYYVTNNLVFPGINGTQDFGIWAATIDFDPIVHCSGNNVIGHSAANIGHQKGYTTTTTENIQLGVNTSPGFRIVHYPAPPSSGDFEWKRGDLVLNNGASSTAKGWLCTVDGSPGTWEELTSGSFATSFIRLTEQGGDPSISADDGYLYVKDDSGDTELFYMDDSGNALQVTKDGALNDGLFSPKAFGAKGDYNPTTSTGTDDTIALQAWLNSGHNLFLDEGVYLFTDTLIVPAGVTILGTGKRRSILWADLPSDGYGLQLGTTLTYPFGSHITLKDFALLGGTTCGYAALYWHHLWRANIDIYINGDWDYMGLAEYLFAAGDAAYAGLMTSHIQIEHSHNDPYFWFSPTYPPSPKRGIYIDGWINANKIWVEISGTTVGDGLHLIGMSGGMTSNIQGVIQSCAGKAIVIENGSSPVWGLNISNMHCESNVGGDISITGGNSIYIGDNVGANITLSNCNNIHLQSFIGKLTLDENCFDIAIDGAPNAPVALALNGARGVTNTGFPISSSYGSILGPTGFTSGDSSNLLLNGDFHRMAGTYKVWGDFPLGWVSYIAEQCGYGKADTTRTNNSAYCIKLRNNPGWADFLAMPIFGAGDLSGYLQDNLVLSFKYKPLVEDAYDGYMYVAITSLDDIGVELGSLLVLNSIEAENGFSKAVFTHKIDQDMIDFGCAILFTVQTPAIMYLSEVVVQFGNASSRDFIPRIISPDGYSMLFGGHIQTWGNDFPVFGGDPIHNMGWQIGDVVWNSTVGEGTPVGWICTTAGSPGVWSVFGGGSLDNAYNGGRTITVDSGPVELNASETEALSIDGYIGLKEISDPTKLKNKGSIYVKETDGYDEFFYIDDYGLKTQVTKKGTLNFDEINLYVPNMATLRTTTGLQNQIIILDGYYVAGDGGGGTFTWSNVVAADDSGTIINPAGGTAVGWRRIYNGPINVKWFGAKGDNVNDDTDALQAAFNSIDDYRSIYFAPGVYIGFINIQNNITVFGYDATLKLPVAGTIDEFTSVVTVGLSWPESGPLVENVKIYGLTIDGYRSYGGPYITYPDAMRMGISIGYADNVLIKDVKIKDCYTDGLLLAGEGSSNVTIDNVISENNWRHGAAILSGNKILINNSIFQNNGGDHTPYGYYGAGIDIEDETTTASDLDFIHIINCQFLNNTNNGISAQTYNNNNIIDLLIEGCKFYNNGSYDILTYGSEYTLKDLRIINNNISSSIYCSGVDGTIYENLYILNNNIETGIICSGTDGTIYESGKIIGNLTKNIQLSTADSYGGFLIESNTIHVDPTPSVLASVGISISGFGTNIYDGYMPFTYADGYAIVVSKNTITGGCYGILVDGKGKRISENTILHTRAVDPGGGYTAGWGISVSGSEHTIIGNNVSDVDCRGISSTATYTSIIGNRVTSSSGGPASGAAGLYSGGNYSIIANNILTGNSGPSSFGDYYIEGTGYLNWGNIVTAGFLSPAGGDLAGNYPNPTVTHSLDSSYNDGRVVTVDAGPIFLDQSNAEVLKTDGYVNLGGRLQFISDGYANIGTASDYRPDTVYARSIVVSGAGARGSELSTGVTINYSATDDLGIGSYIYLGNTNNLPLAIVQLAGSRADSASNLIMASVWDASAASLANGATIRLHSFGWTDNNNAYKEQAFFTAAGGLTLKPLALGTTPIEGKGLVLRNTTAAAAGAQQISPAIYLYGEGWGTSQGATETIGWRVYSLPLQGSTAGTYLYFDAYTEGWNTWYNRVTFDHGGNIIAAANVSSTQGVVQMGATIDIDLAVQDFGLTVNGNYALNIVSQRSSGKYNLSVGLWADVNASSIDLDHKVVSMGWIDNADDYQIMWSIMGDGSLVSSDTSTAIILGQEADSAAAIGVTLGSTSTYSTSGAKLVSFKNGGVEKVYIDKDGFMRTSKGFRVAGDIGSGEANTLTLTGIFADKDATSATLGETPTGISGENVGWIKVYVSGVISYIPYWTA